MQINWFGQACFRIQEKIGSENIVIITDPFGKSCGLKVPKLDADIITVSQEHPEHGNLEGLKDKPFIVKCAGEYDVKGVLIEGIDSQSGQSQSRSPGGNIIYRLELNGVSIVHLGGLGHELDEKQMEKIASPDILLIPVGGGRMIGARTAVELVSRIEPRIVIPMMYKLPDLKSDIQGAEKFIKEIGLKPRQEEKLKLSKKDLPQDETELVILQT